MTDDTVDVPRYARLLWGAGDENVRPGPKRSIDVHEIAAAGVRLADTGGIAAVSMRAVAAELGLSSMALYRYVESKRELVLMVLDSAYGPPPTIRGGRRGWRPQLHDWAVALRDELAAHPWVVSVPVGGPPLLPNSVRWMERALASLADASMRQQQKLSSLLLLDVYVRGQVALASGFDDETATDAGGFYVQRLLSLADPARFPRVHEALLGVATEFAADGPEVAVDEFEFGLATVLDGIAGLIKP